MSFRVQEQNRSMVDMNITPLVDVMLVLLIIFMLAAPMISKTMVLDLPGGPTETPSDEPVTLRIDAEGGLTLDGQILSRTVLDAALRVAATGDSARMLKIETDDEASYERVADVLATARRAGVERIAF
jgi:biopolymer transport protein ExbD